MTTLLEIQNLIPLSYIQTLSKGLSTYYKNDSIFGAEAESYSFRSRLLQYLSSRVTSTQQTERYQTRPPALGDARNQTFILLQWMLEKLLLARSSVIPLASSTNPLLVHLLTKIPLTVYTQAELPDLNAEEGLLELMDYSEEFLDEHWTFKNVVDAYQKLQSFDSPADDAQLVSFLTTPEAEGSVEEIHRRVCLLVALTNVTASWKQLGLDSFHSNNFVGRTGSIPRGQRRLTPNYVYTEGKPLSRLIYDLRFAIDIKATVLVFDKEILYGTRKS